MGGSGGGIVALVSLTLMVRVWSGGGRPARRARMHDGSRRLDSSLLMLATWFCITTRRLDFMGFPQPRSGGCIFFAMVRWILPSCDDVVWHYFGRLDTLRFGAFWSVVLDLRFLILWLERWCR